MRRSEFVGVALAVPVKGFKSTAKFSWFILGLGCGILFLAYPQTQSDVAAGRDVFEAQCLTCHNTDSTEAKDGPGLKGVKNGKLPSGAKATHDAILEIVNKGRGVMPAFNETLTDQQKENVIAYVLTL